MKVRREKEHRLENKKEQEMECRQKGLFEKNHLGQGQQVKSQIRSSRDSGQVGGSCLLHGAVVRAEHTAGSWNQWSQTSKQHIPGSSGCTQREEGLGMVGTHLHTSLLPAPCRLPQTHPFFQNKQRPHPPPNQSLGMREGGSEALGSLHQSPPLHGVQRETYLGQREKVTPTT